MANFMQVLSYPAVTEDSNLTTANFNDLAAIC